MTDTDALRYQTNLSARARRGLILNGVGAGLLSVLSGSQWLSSGHWLQLLIFCIMAPATVLVVVTFVKTRHPLEIFEDRIVLNSALRTHVPLANIEGIGTHPKRGTPSLSYRDDTKGHHGEMLIHWRFIRESQDEVIAQIEAALARSNGG